MERTFALYSPIVDTIKVIRSGKVRRAKLYYLRERTGKSARIAEKIRKNIGIDIETKVQEVNEENVMPSDNDEVKKEEAKAEAPKEEAKAEVPKKEAKAEVPKEDVKKEEKTKENPEEKK